MHYLVDFVDSASDEQITAYLNNLNATILSTYDKFGKVYHLNTDVEPPVTNIVEFCIRDDESPLKLLDVVIDADQNFGKIVTDGSIPTITIPNDQQNWWKFYVLSDPDLDSPTFTTNRRGKGVSVYVLDSGVEITHSEFASATVQNLFSFNNDFTDTKGHGTAIASVISGQTCGLTDATIKSVKIFDINTPTKQSDMLRALDVIYEDYNNSDDDHAVVNCSWAISKNNYIEDKIRIMTQAGIYFVASAGNNGTPIENVTPASMPEVETIGAFNSNLVPCDFSNYTGTSGISVTSGSVNGGELDGWAPGEQIWTAGLNNTYHYTAGTSIAAGIHSGAVAYLLTIGYNFGIDFNKTEDVARYAYCKTNFLDLTDPKYANSKNLITCYKDSITVIGQGIPVTYMYKEQENLQFRVALFNPYFIKKYEILSDLPENWNVSTLGKLHGITPSLNNSERFRILKLPIRATFNDGSIENYTFNLLILANDFDVENEKTGDPVLDIELQGTSCNNNLWNDCGQSISNCTQNCNTPTFFCYFNANCKPSLGCGCNTTDPQFS